ncbi:hypothetical protein LOZ65_002195 [Ophidiomyces ophidiicola]|nr:hypothetical protein LOZ65_002195 [Ophidiomyces ophidiicola]
MASTTTEISPIPGSMRAAVHRRTGEPSKILQLEDVPVPPLPTETSVLVRVSHVAIHPGTVILMHLIPSLFRRFPAIAETDFSGTVVKIGGNVPTKADKETDFRFFPVGTPVFGSFQVPVHLRTGQGALAEYVAVESSSIAQMPSNTSFAAASALSVSLYTAITLVDAMKLPLRSKVLVNAPCGGVGNFTTQLLRNRDPDAIIVGVCSTEKVVLAKELGCNEAVDYKSFPNKEHKSLTDYLASRYGTSEDGQFDAVFDAYGSQDLWEASPQFLKRGKDHAYVTVGPKVGRAFSCMPGFFWKVFKNMLWPSWLGGVPRTYKQVSAFLDTDGLEKCREAAANGSVKTVVGGVWKMEQMKLAYDAFMEGHAEGKLVVEVWDPKQTASG